MNTNDKYWLAGWLEGEGSFMKGPPSRATSPLISAETTDRDIAERVAELFGITYIQTVNRPPWKQSYRIQLRGEKGVNLMRKLYPLMGERRQGQITNALSTYMKPKNATTKLTQNDVDKIRERYKIGETITQIALDYPTVCRRYVSDICHGKKWKVAA